MHREREHRVDLLLDSENGEGLSAALSTNDFCLQWHGIREGTLGAMRKMLSRPSGAYQEIIVGRIFHAELLLVEREGIFSFKVMTASPGADLLRLDLSQENLAGTISALDDAIAAWETE
jgi:hypothetical protein